MQEREVRKRRAEDWTQGRRKPWYSMSFKSPRSSDREEMVRGRGGVGRGRSWGKETREDAYLISWQQYDIINLDYVARSLSGQGDN